MKINRTLFRAIQILDYIAEQKEGVTIVDLVAQFGFPKTSIYDILTTLLHQHMIYAQRGGHKRYFIGVKSFSIGSKFNRNQDFISVASPILQRLSHKLNSTTFLAIEDNGYVVYIGKYEPENPILTTASLGSRKPMYCTGLGKAILAAYSEKEVDARLRLLPMKQKTSRTLTHRGALLLDLEKTRQRGFALDDREQENYLMCVAAPIYNHEMVIGAISTSFVYQGNEDVPTIGKLVCEVAMDISRQLAYTGEKLYL